MRVRRWLALPAGALALALLSITGASADGQEGADAVRLLAEHYGLKADGITDDGPAIARMLDAAREADGPVVLAFPSGGAIRVETAPTRYVFPLDGLHDIEIDGGGSTFLLAPHLRFASLVACDRVALHDLSVDFAPLPFADGTVISLDPEGRTLEVRLDGAEPVALAGGPTGKDGEQAFFGMLWFEGPYSVLSRHCWIEAMEPTDEPGVVRVHAGESFHEWADIVPGAWRMSLPVPGIAHRFGPGPCFRIDGCGEVTLDEVELWSAPWFGFEVTRNHGPVTFRRTHIRPKPGSGRLMSTWRDGFHVKANSGPLLWEDCEMVGMNDDALNLSTHTSTVLETLSPTEIRVGQKFPLLPVPWNEGATLTAVDEASGRLLGESRIVEATTGPAPEPIQGQPAAPVTTLRLAESIAGLGVGTMVWDRAQCNPDTTLRRCTIRMSCRLQSPVRMEDCDVAALLWFYAEHVEGGFPRDVSLTGCTLRRGRGNPRLAVMVSGGPSATDAAPDAGRPPRAVHGFELRDCEVWGDLRMVGVEGTRLVGNRFLERGAALDLTGCFDVVEDGNTDPNGASRSSSPRLRGD